MTPQDDELKHAQINVEQSRQHLEGALNALESKIMGPLEHFRNPIQLAKDHPIGTAIVALMAGYFLGSTLGEENEKNPEPTQF